MNDSKIDAMQKGGKILQNVFNIIEKTLLPGITTHDLNQIAEKEIYSQNAEPGFKRVPEYHHATCICINEEVVHTPPSNKKIQKDDIVTIDMGVYYNGYHTDAARSYLIDSKDKNKLKFLEAGKKALQKAIESAIPGNHIGHISQSIEKNITTAGYTIIKPLTGHGVGVKLHEDPIIPGFLDKPIQKTLMLNIGMTLAVEVIYSTTCDDIKQDGSWSLVTKDNSLSACFEHTIVITKHRPLILA